MKIFKLNDSDWVAAESLESAKKCLADMINDGVVDAAFEDEYIDTPYELDEEEMNTIKMTDEEDYYEMNNKADQDSSGKSWQSYYDEYIESCPTFKQELDRMIAEGKEFPMYFASSEW